MPDSVAMPAVRQNRSKLAPTCCQASSTIAAGTIPAARVDFVMALLSFADSAPRAYRLKVGNAYLTFSTSTGASPRLLHYPGNHFRRQRRLASRRGGIALQPGDPVRKVALLPPPNRRFALTHRAHDRHCPVTCRR